MVNKKRVKNKLPILLADGPLTVKSNLYKYQTRRKKLHRIEKRHPAFFNRYLWRIVRALDEFERALENTDFEF